MTAHYTPRMTTPRIVADTVDVQGKRHGEGTQSSSDGTKYVGGWERNMRHGQGKLSQPNKEASIYSRIVQAMC